MTLPAQVGHEALRGRVRVVPRALTQDRYSAERPCYSPSGRYVAFQSNRDDIKDARIQDKQEVYLLDLKSKAVQRLTTGRWGNHSPRFGREDGQIYFVSNRSGIDNLYLLHWKSDSLWPITNLSSAISGPSLAADGRSAAFAVFEEGGWDIYLLKDPELMRRNTPLPRSRFIEVAEDTTGQERFFAPIALHNLKSYRSQSSMDSLERVLQSKKEGQAESAGDNRVEPNTSLDDDGFFLDPVPASADSQSQAPLKKDTLTQDSASQRIAPGWADNDSLDVFLQDAQPFREDGSLFTKPYQAQWSMDQFVAVAGYSSSNGMGGEGLLTLTDLMGDQEVNLWFFGAGGLDNINLFIEYGYLPMRTDWRLAAFHTYSEGTERMSEARYEKLRGRDGGSDTLWGYAPYGDRNMGGALLTNYPLSLFSRISMGNQLTWRTRSWKLVEDESYSGSSWTRILKNDPSAAPEEANTWELSLGWSFDNAQWGVTGPMEGNRLWAGVQGIVPGVLQESMGYWRADMDMRKYFRVFRRYSFAFRAAGGLSESWDGHVNPHRYLVGGDAMTINWNVNWDHWRGTQNDIHFSSMETPLRGFRYNDFTGTRMGVLNAEFRFPLIDQLSLGWPIPLTITHVTGVLFSDFGGTWEDRRILENRGWSAGWGWRLNLGIFVLRYTRAWSHQEFSTVKRNDYTYWSLGAEF